MGYFSNGTEGDLYEEEYCDRCVHQDEDVGCPIMDLHFIHNFEGAEAKDHFLHSLIPLSEDGYNEQCRLFWERDVPLDLHRVASVEVYRKGESNE